VKLLPRHLDYRIKFDEVEEELPDRTVYRPSSFESLEIRLKKEVQDWLIQTFTPGVDFTYLPCDDSGNQVLLFWDNGAAVHFRLMFP
jgi:hypothetical protein